MDEEIYVLNCGGDRISYSFQNDETRRLFGSYLEMRKEQKNGNQIQVTCEYMEENRWLVDKDEKSDAFLEFQCLMLATGNRLLSSGRALFHGAAFIWKDLGWIFTAPSGTGKTTQLKNWYSLWGKDLCVINGDKPVLECRRDGSVRVHSSPWMGKERIGTRGASAKLGGIILLEQGKQNSFRRLSAEEAVHPLFVEFVSYPENTEEIIHQAGILNHILDAVPVWKLVNVGDAASAKMTREALCSYLENANE